MEMFGGLSSNDFGIRNPSDARSTRHTNDDSAVKQKTREASLTTNEKKFTREKEVKNDKLWVEHEAKMEQLEADMQQIQVKMQQLEADNIENRAKMQQLQWINEENQEKMRRLIYEKQKVEIKMYRWATDLKDLSPEMSNFFCSKILQSLYMLPKSLTRNLFM